MNNELRFAHVDAMRGIAALLVVWIHVSESLAGHANGGLWLHVVARDLKFGSIGVSLFFIVSGFVIPASLRRTGDLGEDLKVFAVRRFFRLYPVYWVSIILASIVWWAWKQPVDPARLVANVTMLQRILGYEDIQGLYWTLATEMGFYLTCAALFVLGLLHRPIVLLGMSAAFLAIWHAGVSWPLIPRDGVWGFLFATDFAANFSLMFTGALLRTWYNGEPMPGWIKLGLVLLVGFVLLPLGTMFSIVDQRLAVTIPNWGRAVALVIFLNFALGLRLAHPVLSKLGEMSYSLYLFHPVIFYAFIWFMTRRGMEWSRGWHLGVYLALLAGITVAFSALTYRFIELPMVRRGRLASKAIRDRASTPASAQLHA